MKRIDLLVGPNGAGKSTVFEFVLADERPDVPFVNADVIAEQRWPADPVGHGHDAAIAAEEARRRLLRLGESFIAETVGSHPSKVEFVRQARLGDYHVHLIIVAVPEHLAVERVRSRVTHGGHDVPEHKIRKRYRRLWTNVVDMIEIASSAIVIDNTGETPRIVATFSMGESVGSPDWPEWMDTALRQRWPSSTQ